MLAKRDHLFIKCKHAVLTGGLCLRIARGIFLSHIQPRFGFRKAAIPLPIPREGRAGIVTASPIEDTQGFFLMQSRLDCAMVLVYTGYVAELIEARTFEIYHSQLLPLIKERRAAQKEIHGA